MTVFLKKLIKITLSIVICGVFTLVTGCKEIDPNPELKDPIYLDLKELSENLSKEVEKQEKELPKLKQAIKDEKVRTLSLKLAKKKFREAAAKLRKVRQDAHYTKIRAEKRRILGRRMYKVAFQKGEPWPDPLMIKRYRTNQKLRAADLNWNKRVPKLQSANPNYSGQEVKEEK